MIKSRENAKKPVFPAYFSFENWVPSLFGHCHFASLCQKSEKTNEQIPEKSYGNRRTNGRMEEHCLI